MCMCVCVFVCSLLYLKVSKDYELGVGIRVY